MSCSKTTICNLRRKFSNFGACNSDYKVVAAPACKIWFLSAWISKPRPMFQDYNFAISDQSFQTSLLAILIIKLSRDQRAKFNIWARQFPSQVSSISDRTHLLGVIEPKLFTYHRFLTLRAPVLGLNGCYNRFQHTFLIILVIFPETVHELEHPILTITINFQR